MLKEGIVTEGTGGTGEAAAAVDNAAEVARIKAEKEAEYWRGVSVGMTTTPTVTKEPVAPVEPEKPLVEPRFEDFTTPAEFENARTDWLRKVAAQDAAKKVQEQSEMERRRDAVAAFNKRISDASATDPDIVRIRDTVGRAVAQHTAELIIESEMAPELIRYLHEHPGEMNSINTGSPLRAAKQVGRIEEELKRKREGGTAKKVSDAPPPTPTVKTGGSGLVDADPTSPDSDKISANDWIARRNAQIRRGAVAA